MKKLTSKRAETAASGVWTDPLAAVKEIEERITQAMGIPDELLGKDQRSRACTEIVAKLSWEQFCRNSKKRLLGIARL